MIKYAVVEFDIDSDGWLGILSYIGNYDGIVSAEKGRAEFLSDYPEVNPQMCQVIQYVTDED